MKVYKITDENMRTYNGCQWELNVTKETYGQGELCSNQFLHFYHHPLIASIMHTMLGFKNPRLFEAKADGIIKNDFYLKGGCSKLTLKKEINLPQFTPTQRIACGILFAKGVCKEEQWNTWATNWLNGTDRTEQSAYAASRAAYATDAARNAANAARYDAYVSYNNVSCSVSSSIESNPDTFSLEHIITTINKALEY